MKLSKVCCYNSITVLIAVLFFVGDKIAEVRRIMGPRQSVSYSPATNEFSGNKIPRRPKRKGKYQLAVGRYGSNTKKPRSSAASFQKKLYVFKYMGSNTPENYTRSDKDIVTRGLLNRFQ